MFKLFGRKIYTFFYFFLRYSIKPINVPQLFRFFKLLYAKLIAYKMLWLRWPLFLSFSAAFSTCSGLIYESKWTVKTKKSLQINYLFISYFYLIKFSLFFTLFCIFFRLYQYSNKDLVIQLPFLIFGFSVTNPDAFSGLFQADSNRETLLTLFFSDFWRNLKCFNPCICDIIHYSPFPDVPGVVFPAGGRHIREFFAYTSSTVSTIFHNA